MEGCRPLPNTQHSTVGDSETLSLCGLGASLLRARHSHSPVRPLDSLMYPLHSSESAEKYCYQ